MNSEIILKNNSKFNEIVFYLFFFYQIHIFLDIYCWMNSTFDRMFYEIFGLILLTITFYFYYKEHGKFGVMSVSPKKTYKKGNDLIFEFEILNKVIKIKYWKKINEDCENKSLEQIELTVLYSKKTGKIAAYKYQDTIFYLSRNYTLINIQNSNDIKPLKVIIKILYPIILSSFILIVGIICKISFSLNEFFSNLLSLCSSYMVIFSVFRIWSIFETTIMKSEFFSQILVVNGEVIYKKRFPFEG